MSAPWLSRFRNTIGCFVLWWGAHGLGLAELQGESEKRSAEIVHAADQAALIMVILVSMVLIGVVFLALKIRKHTRRPDEDRRLLDDLGANRQKNDSKTEPWEKPADWWK